MASTAKNRFKKLYQQLQKEYRAGIKAMPYDREVLVQLIFSALLENSPSAAALKAFDIIEETFIDWNELRVSSTSELVKMLPQLGDSRKSCERVRQTLQTIFQASYQFDLEDWRGKSEKEFREYLVSIPFTTRFMVDYTVKAVFHGQEIPLDEGAMRVFRLLDLVDIDSENHEVVRGINGLQEEESTRFAMQLHELGAVLFSPDPAPALKFLETVDPESVQRSFIPLVDIEEEDPRQIARRLANQRHHSMKMNFSEDMDSEEDDFIESTDSLEEQLPYDGTPYGEGEDSSFEASESSSSARKDSAKEKENLSKESKPKKAQTAKPAADLKAVPRTGGKTSLKKEISAEKPESKNDGKTASLKTKKPLPSPSKEKKNLSKAAETKVSETKKPLETKKPAGSKSGAEKSSPERSAKTPPKSAPSGPDQKNTKVKKTCSVDKPIIVKSGKSSSKQEGDTKSAGKSKSSAPKSNKGTEILKKGKKK